MRIPRIVMAAGLVLAQALTSAHAEKRVALVVGNDCYPNQSSTEQLQKAENEAQAVDATLRQIGFDVVSGENLGRQAPLAQLPDPARHLAPGDTVFFFFAGHGVAVDSTNYILPADVLAIRAGQIASLTGTAVREQDIIDRFLRAGPGGRRGGAGRLPEQSIRWFRGQRHRQRTRNVWKQ
jgi:Caspase domain